MEQISVWLTVAGVIVFPFIGWIFNTLITNKINDLKKDHDDTKLQLEEYKELFFKRLDALKENVEHTYVRKDIYDQATLYHLNSSDEKFKSLLSIVNTQFQNIEDKIISTDEKIDDLKEFIKEKLNDGKK